ncbi:SIALI-17 repeat-containing surface protein [Streptococcus infantis]|uniref:Zinc metalloprotease n=1 Tax=Streptococcus infantis TaxID=68892 RepID=A0A0F3HGW0_9STRE|nr:SIALI-17 repeat-containing surface protein [Streptococcus infantis]KJU93441.1 zinc metalloprotease [Streptococcus infantis]
MEDRKKLQKFAIRKLSMGVGSVLIGLAFIGGTLEPKLVQADETKQVSFHYLAESELTAAERELIHHELPQDLSQDNYYLVYRKQGQAVLPQTGSISFPLAGVGLLTASLVVFLFSKKKPSKIVGVLLIASVGKSLLLPYQVFAFEHKDLLAYDQTKTLVSADGFSQGIIDIKGYDYIGYLLESDLRGTGQDLTSSENSEIPAKPVNQAAIHEIPEFIGGVSGESLVEPTKPAFEGGVNGPGAVAEALPEYKAELTSQSGVPEVHDKSDFTGGVSGDSLVEPSKPSFEGGVNGPGAVAEALPEYKQGFSSQSGVPEVHDKPDFTGGVSGESLVEPSKPAFEGGVNGPGAVAEALPEYTPELSSQSGIPEVHDKADFTGGVSGESLVEPTKPTFEGGVNGSGTVAEALPEYEGGAVPVDTLKQEHPEFTGGVSGDSLVEPTKPTFEGGVNGQGAVAETLPEYEGGAVPVETLKQEIPEFTGSVSGDSLVEPTKPTFEGGVNGPGTVSEALPEYEGGAVPVDTLKQEHPEFTGGVSGDSLVEPTKPTFEGGVNGQGAVVKALPAYEGGAVPVDTLKQEIPSYSGGVNAAEALIQDTNPTLHIEVRKELIPKQTREKIDPDMLVGETRIEQVGQDGEKEIVTSYEEKDGKRISEPKETTRILREAKDQVIIRGSKEKEEIKPEPVLTLSNITGNSMGRSARLSYNLNKADGVTVSKISATIKAKGVEDQTIDLTSDQLEATVDNLKLYTDYTISTRLVFNRGKGEESALLEDKKLRLELKKLEIKDIKETSLIKVNNGRETEIQQFAEAPRNLENYYLKVSSKDHKTSRLAIKSIQTERINGKEYYKVTAEATDLIQRNAQKTFEEGFSYYLAKSSADTPTIAGVKDTLIRISKIMIVAMIKPIATLKNYSLSTIKNGSLIKETNWILITI